MKTIAIVQARMGSTRLPGKVLKVAAGKPLLWHLFDRLKHSKEIHDIVLATSKSPNDNALQSFAEEFGFPFFRGSEKNVLERYYETAAEFNGDTIVRVTGDNPLIDPRMADKIIRKHLSSGADYTSNTLKKTYPIGLSVEVFQYGALERANKEAKHGYEREHVTPYFYLRPEKFKIQSVEARGKLRRPDLRLTLDTSEDLVLIKKVFEELYRPGQMFYTEDIIDLFGRKPQLAKINAKVRQKELKEK